MTRDETTNDEPGWRGFRAHLAVTTQGDERVGSCLPALGSRPYGGHLIAQALVLVLDDASPGFVPLTVHTHFLSMGDAGKPIRYRTDRLRAGRSFEHWSVDARQDDVLLTRVTVVLHQPEAGPSHAVRPSRMSSMEGPSALAVEPPHGSSSILREGLEIRRGAQWQPGDEGLHYQDRWIRCLEPVPAAMNEVVLAWCSDLELAPTVDLPYTEGLTSRVGASLEHSIRFHAPIDVTRWWLLEQDSPALSNGRGLAVARAFTADGELVASIVQHTMVRLSFETTP
jgi:acyl-CoA thioesterase-2